MAIHESPSLSRAVSFVDLNAALLATQKTPREGCYGREEMLTLRPKADSSVHAGERSGVVSPGAENADYPNPPPSTPHDPTAADLAEIDLEEQGIQIVPPGSEASKEKKKKSSRANKKPKPTGFEEFYADPPITPLEAKEESAVYDVSVPFHQRIETCMQKYRARRNLDSIRSNILTKYFMLGGIDATPRAFTGSLDKETIANSTAEEIRAMTATDFVGSGNKKYYDPAEPENWVVDFEGVARGFFSERVPQIFCVDRKEDIVLYSHVVRNFLNYVLSHNVCPEYNDDVMATREICNKAENELWACQQFRWEYPGDFNMAASNLFGGRYRGMHASTQTWEQQDPDNAAWNTLSPGMSIARADRIFRTAIAFEGNDAMFFEVTNNAVKVVKSETKYLEVVKIVGATHASVQQYAGVKDDCGITGTIKALGVLIVKPWTGPSVNEEEVSSDEDDLATDSTAVADHAQNDKSNEHKNHIMLWLEDDILKLLFVGMKMEMTLHELNIGVTYFDTMGGPYCSFYMSLENEKMVDWKEPVPNTRPAPSEDNPNAEENILNADMEDEIKNDEKLSISK